MTIDQSSILIVDDVSSVRYFLNLGSRDNFDWMSLKDFLRDTLDLGRDDLFKALNILT